jgi:hypothetical protein
VIAGNIRYVNFRNEHEQFHCHEEFVSRQSSSFILAL